MDAVGIFAEKIRKVGLNTLHHGVNGINNAISSGDGIAGHQIKNQKAFPVIRSGCQAFITNRHHQFIHQMRQGSLAGDGWLRGDDDRPAVFQNHALKPNIVIKKFILQCKPVQIFGWRCPVSQRPQSQTVAFLLFEYGGFKKPPEFFVEINAVLTTAGIFGRQFAA